MLADFVKKHCENVFKHPHICLASLLCLTIFLGFFYVTLPTETSVESLIIKNDPDLLFYEQFKEQFGDDEILIVGFSHNNIYQPKVINFIEKQTTQLEQLSTVREVISLSNIDDFIGSDSDFIVQPLLDSYDGNNISEFKNRAKSNSMIINNLVNKEGTAALFLIRPASNTSDPNFDDQFITQVENVFKNIETPWQGFSYHLAGWSATDVNLSRFMAKDMMVFMPLTYFLLIILVGISLRNVWAIVLAIINVSICLIWTLAFLNIIGGAMSPITSILPPLIMALAVSDSIHIFTDFLKHDRTKSKLPEVIKVTLSNLAVPCFLTSLTTAIGFASLAVSDVPPIGNFGIAAAMGMIAEYILSMTIIPLGIYYLKSQKSLKQKPSNQKVILPGLLERYAARLPQYKSVILGVSAVIVVLSIFLTLQINVETNLLEYFKKNSHVYQDSHFIDTHLGGVETIEVSLTAPEPDQLLNPINLEIVQKIESYLLQQLIVTEVTSIADFFREMNKAFHNEDTAYFKLPESRAMAAQYLLLYDGSELDNILDDNRQWTRISARITEHNSAIVEKYLTDLQQFLDQITYGSEITARISGKTLIANKLISFIVNSQIQSLSLAFILIFLVMFAIFKSFKFGLISIIPNLLPILFNFALMGALNIPLNSATAIIAAVAIGIAVDDTIHFICEYQQLKAQGIPTENAIKAAIVTKGHPIITTSLIMTGGFGILLLASFVPSIQFGFLSALIMGFAVISDLLILPAIFLITDIKGH